MGGDRGGGVIIDPLILNEGKGIELHLNHFKA